ncbi:MAG: hypothetical protein LBE50_05605 [Gallionellaceae bacterium]|nr:hypothetical protein [Gallionellaceae bacterium]
MKAQALGYRTKSRDLFDVDTMIRNGDTTIRAVIEELQQTNPYAAYETLIYRILEKPLDADDEGLGATRAQESVETIRNRLKNDILELNLEISRAVLDEAQKS